MKIQCSECGSWNGRVLALCGSCDGSGEIDIMTFDEYNQETLKTAKYPSMGNNILYPLTGLLEEAGEIAGVIKKAQRTLNEDYEGNPLFFTGSHGVSYIPWGMNEDAEKTRDKLLDECGDELWYLNRVIEEAGSSLEEVARRNIKKVQQRLKDGTLLATEKRPFDDMPEYEAVKCDGCLGEGEIFDSGENRDYLCGKCNGTGYYKKPVLKEPVWDRCSSCGGLNCIC